MKGWKWGIINGYTLAVRQVELLKEMYKNQFGENDARTILLTAYIGLLKVQLYIKEGPRTIEEAFNKADSNDVYLMDRLNKIREIEERILDMYRYYEFKNLDLLDVPFTEIYQKAKSRASLYD